MEFFSFVTSPEVLNMLTVVYHYVKMVTYRRDASHGINHMEKVLINTYNILNAKSIDICSPLGQKACVVALVHDVCDHKYSGGKDSLKLFLGSLKLEATSILEIVDHISFSKERKARLTKPLNFVEILGEQDALIRNIVSDADKMEALGREGLTRCIEYIMSNNPLCTPEECKKLVRQHAEEKLLLLYEAYISTPEGKKLCYPLYKEFVILLENYAT